jgi:hypothetical protein
MKTRTFLATVFGFAIAAGGCVGSSDASLETQDELNGQPEPAPPGTHGFLQRGYAHSKGGGGSPDMTFHGGNVLHTNTVLAIFWGTEWTTDSSDKIPGIDSFFSGLNGSNFAATSDEYSDGSGNVTSSTTYLGHTIDASTAPKRAINTSTAVSEACAQAGQNPDPNAIYFLFTSTGAGHVNYCAWHSWGNCSNGMPIQVAYMPNIDGIAGCDPQDTYGTGHSQGLAALANVTSHEWSEARTDPRGSGWYDAGGAENGDKCAWAFEGPVKLGNRSTWKLQMEWSNAAYDAGTGQPNLSGQNGCLQGQ